jgi:hypothetical protein
MTSNRAASAQPDAPVQGANSHILALISEFPSDHANARKQIRAQPRYCSLSENQPDHPVHIQALRLWPESMLCLSLSRSVEGYCTDDMHTAICISMLAVVVPRSRA